MSGTEEEKAGFLARWSRRKLAPEPEAASPPAVPEALPGAPADAEAQTDVALPRPPAACPIPGGPEIDLASLPPLESLTVASDVTPFLRAGVPSALRNAALRRMWSLDPSIRDFINCVDYQWDFNTPGGLPHGFANELVGDIGKMLAQAIGYDPTAKPGEADAEAAGPSPDAVPEPGAAPLVELPADSPSPTRLTLVEAPPPAVEPPTPEPGAPRRRHGSALPG
jgi:hypothetical protein